MDYVYLRAWNRMMGSAPYWNEETLDKARREKAPDDAIYNTVGVGAGGEWRCFKDVTRSDTRLCIEKIISEQSHTL